MEEAQRVVHVGYAKAGSSFLQHSVFPLVSRYEYINYTKGKSFYNYLIESGLFYNVNHALSLLGAKTNHYILSNELLAGNPIRGTGINSSTIPTQLKETGFTKVIISSRRDKEKWKGSIYNQYVKLGGKLNWKDYVENPLRFDSEYTWYHPFMIEKADEYIAYYKKVFGEKNVLVLYIEDYKTDSGKFLSSIREFLKCELKNEMKASVNESMPFFLLKVVRFLNNFTSSRMSPSSAFRWFSTVRIIRFSQLFMSKSITKRTQSK